MARLVANRMEDNRVDPDLSLGKERGAKQMRMSLDFSSLRRVKYHEYAVRFLLGGLVTLATGLIAHSFGAAIGGLFLAFPAIFPASCTLVEKHEAEKKKNRGLRGTVRGRKAAALDSFGAALGSIGLAGFAVVGWRCFPTYAAALVLFSATFTWLAISLAAWEIRNVL